MIGLLCWKRAKEESPRFCSHAPFLAIAIVRISILDQGSLSVVGRGKEKGNKAKEGLTAELLSPISKLYLKNTVLVV